MHPYCARFVASLVRAQSARTSREYKVSYETKLTREKKSHLLLNKYGDLSFFPHIFDLPFNLFLFKELEKKTWSTKKFITRNALLMEIKSRPREHAREEGFKSISSDASSICHKTSSKLLFVIDILRLVRCFKIYFNYVLTVPVESRVN